MPCSQCKDPALCGDCCAAFVRQQREREERPCTCHPDDNPPQPCPRKYALSECEAAAGVDAPVEPIDRSTERVEKGGADRHDSGAKGTVASRAPDIRGLDEQDIPAGVEGREPMADKLARINAEPLSAEASAAMTELFEPPAFRCAREGMCDATPRCTVQCAACACWRNCGPLSERSGQGLTGPLPDDYDSNPDGIQPGQESPVRMDPGTGAWDAPDPSGVKTSGGTDGR